MNIGFDLDKIFIDYPPFVPDWIIDRMYRKRSNGKLVYRIPSTLEQYFRIITHFPFFRPPITKNISIIKELTKNKSHKYFLISSRFGFLKNTTDKLIKTHGFNEIFDGMYFNYKNEQPHLFKNRILQDRKIDRYVDDDLPLLKFLQSRHPKTFFFWLNKFQTKSITSNLMAIRNLSDIK